MAVPLTLSSVPVQTPYVQYVATSNQTVFPYPFEITQDSDLVVLINAVQQATDSGYTLSGQGATGGGNLTFNSGQTAGAIITLYRNISIARVTQLAANGTFFSSNFNNEYNRIYLILQQLQEAAAFYLQVPNSNNPAPTALLTPANYANKYLSFDSNGNPTPAALTSSGSVTGALVAGLLNAVTNIAPIASLLQSATELAAGVTPTNFTYPVGDVRRYGAVLNGVTDDTTAIQNWAKIGGRLVFPVAQTALISAPIPLVSNSVLEFAPGATIKNATNNINMLTLTTLSNVTIRGGTFLSTAATSATQVGGVVLTSCTDCIVEDCEFSGMPFNGIWATAVSYCTFRANYFVSSAGPATQNSADINLVSSASVTSSYNVVEGNFCVSGANFGVAVWDPYSGVLPIHNVVSNNRISGATGYGILIYMPDAGDSYNQVLGNHVEGVTGNGVVISGSGAGIYLAGAGLGGTVVANNTVYNCCITTNNASLAPAGIGVNGSSVTGGVPVSIVGNVITGMTQYHGILVTGVIGAAISGNSVRMPATQSTIGQAIAVVNSNRIAVTGNVINLLTTTQAINGIFVEAIGAPFSDVAITGNTINGGHYAQIRLVNNGQLYGHITISGNTCTGGDASCIPLILESGSCLEVQVVGNTFNSSSATAISQTACTDVRYSANFLTGTGAALLTAGVCTNSFYDRTNFGTGAAAGVNNGATGFIIEILGSAVPSVGTWAVGDTVRNSAPSAAGVYEWICTTAGTPGTWKTISNT